MMRMCDRCLENSWSYEYIEGYIRATCNFCSYEVEFESKKLKRQLEKQRTIIDYA